MSTLKQKLSKVSPLSATIVLIFAAIMTYVIIQAFAAKGPATLYTAPGGTQSTVQGSTFSVNVRISTAGNVPVTGAAVYMTYPANKLSVQSVTYNGSPYNVQLVESNANGTLRMDRGAFPMIPGGDKLFATVTFKANAAGPATIAFSSNSVVTSGEDDSNILAARNGVTYNITNPPPAPSPPPPSPSPPPSGGGSSSGSSGGSTGSGTGSSQSPSSSSPSSSPSGGQPGSQPTGSGNSSGGSTESQAFSQPSQMEGISALKSGSSSRSNSSSPKKFNPWLVLGLPLAGAVLVTGLLLGRPWIKRRIAGLRASKLPSVPVAAPPQTPMPPVFAVPVPTNTPGPGSVVTPDSVHTPVPPPSDFIHSPPSHQPSETTTPEPAVHRDGLSAGVSLQYGADKR